jgi:hypothetical protein
VIQIILLVLGAIAGIMGLTSAVKGEVKLSPRQTLRGQQALLAGIGTMVLGLAIIAFALVGLPMMMGR